MGEPIVVIMRVALGTSIRCIIVVSKGLLVPKKHEAEALRRKMSKMRTLILLEFFLKPSVNGSSHMVPGQVQSFKPYPDCTSTMWYINYFESEGIMILATLSLTLLRHDNLLLCRTMYVGPCFVPRNKTTSCKTRGVCILHYAP
jgi:hypothetical protein